MAWKFRKSIKLPAGVRVNLSNSGVGISDGVPGARIGINSKGQTYKYLSIPGTGLYNRSPLNQHSTGFWSIVLTVIALVLAAFGRKGRKHRDWA